MSCPFALLMDLDGTLLDTDPLHIEAFRRLLQPFGRTVTESYYTSDIMGAPIETITAALFPEASPEEQRRLGERKEQLLHEQLAGPLEPKAGLHAFLEWAKANDFGIGIVTNATRENAVAMLRGIDVLGLVDQILIGAELPHAKPHPFPYAEAARRLNVSMGRALAFEDSGPGVASAAAAGACTFGLEGAFDEARLLAAGASYTIADYTSPRLWQTLSELTGTPAHATEGVR